MNVTYRFTSDAAHNATVAPMASKGNLFAFSYYTLCRIADATHHTYATPDTLALHCKHALKGSDALLTLDALGNFVSLTPIA